MKRTVIGAAVLALGISTVGVAAADKPGDTDTTKTAKDFQSRNCEDGDTVTLAGPDTLWPPNHKMVAQLATATDGDSASVTDEASDATTLTLVFDLVESATGGDGNTPIDYEATGPNPASGSPSASVPFNVRAERSGRADGRTYVIDWVATFDGYTESPAGIALSGKKCTSMDAGQSPFTIFVPHDQGQGNDA